MEYVQKHTESSFQLPKVKEFVLGEGPIVNESEVIRKRLKEVVDARLKLLIMELLENPQKKRKVGQAIAEFKKDVLAYDKMEKNIILDEKVKAEQARRLAAEKAKEIAQSQATLSTTRLSSHSSRSS